MNNYPCVHDLKEISEWDFEKKSVREFLDLLDVLWDVNYGDHNWDNNKHFLSTGGWSGNEAIIQAIQENRIFWSMCWQESRRGGHYKFDLTKLINIGKKETK